MRRRRASAQLAGAMVAGLHEAHLAVEIVAEQFGAVVAVRSQCFAAIHALAPAVVVAVACTPFTRAGCSCRVRYSVKLRECCVVCCTRYYLRHVGLLLRVLCILLMLLALTASA